MATVILPIRILLFDDCIGKTGAQNEHLFLFDKSRPVSRVLSRTTIYLGRRLPDGSSHLLRTARAAICPPTVLLRIEFTAPTRLRAAGGLLPHLSTLARFKRTGRFISVALVRGSPLAGVTRYPCPVEPGLSSCMGFRPVPAVVRPAQACILIILPLQVNPFLFLGRNRSIMIFCEVSEL